MPSVFTAARRVLAAADPLAKAQVARQMRRDWLAVPDMTADSAPLPEQPARPARPELVPPLDVPRRRLGSEEGRGALLHAIAHIELNAIDLAADMIARFAGDPMIADTADFISDWTSVCDDEARHFGLLHERLGQLGMSYGDCPAHNGLWEAARETRHDITARMAIAPLVLEARGLDVTPGMIEKLTSVGDMDSVAVLRVIYNEEIGHVAIGAKWFQILAESLGEAPEPLFHRVVAQHFRGRVKPPFNVQARTLAGLTPQFYMPLSA